MFLAEQYGNPGWTPTSEIAEQAHIPRRFLEVILVQLRDGGIVDSHRGSHGGHRLSCDPTTISVAAVMRVVDGPLALTSCASVTRFRPCTDCPDVRTCRIQHLMRDARNAVANVLENCSLISLAQPAGPNPQAASDVGTFLGEPSRSLPAPIED